MRSLRGDREEGAWGAAGSHGIKSVKADHTTGTVKIEAEDGIEESKIKEKIENIGFDVK